MSVADKKTDGSQIEPETSEESLIDVASIFPKKLPVFRVGPVYDECGFPLNERLALRQAWKLIKPFERRYGKEIYFDYLMKHYQIFENFRVKGKLDLHRLHGHNLAFMRYIKAIIEQNDPAIFQSMLMDCHNVHSRSYVSMAHMKALLEALIVYVLTKLKDVCSDSLRSGFQRLVEKFQFDLAEKVDLPQSGEEDDADEIPIPVAVIPE